MKVAGLLLAAGRGERMGVPKALVRDADGVGWLASSHQVLLDGGCAETLIVLGASADEAAALLADAPHVVAPDWAEGMGASLRAGLARLAQESDSEAALVHLVDLPDVNAAAVARVIAHAGPDALVRATYDGQPGHPVVIGRNHWSALLADLHGDEGARRYLAGHETIDIECGDLATGRDVDTPEGL